MANANDSVYGGYGRGYGRWNGGLKLGNVNAPPIMQRVDPTLPGFSQELPYPSKDFVVIPAGRILAAKATDLTTAEGWTTITLANGVSPFDAPSFATGCIPVGYTETKIMRDFPGLRHDPPVFLRHETIEVPYTAINESYNNILDSAVRIKAGEWLMPYYGSKNAKAGLIKDKGKLVRWHERKAYSTTAAASANVILASAPYPAFKPRVLQAWRGSTIVTSGTANLVYNETHARWVAEFANTDVTTVWYEYGASVNQRIAQCVGVEPVGTAGGINATSHEMAGWLKWITDNFSQWDWPLMMAKRPNTSVTDESVSVSSNTGTLAHSPVVPWASIIVKVTGSYLDEDGATVTLTATEMDLADAVTFQDYTQGRYYDIDMLTGVIRFSSNVTVASCTVSYSYETDYRNGLKYDGGTLGLTDGTNSGVIGIPPHLDVAGAYGALRVMIL